MWVGLLYFSSVAFICNARVLEEGCMDLKENPVEWVPPKVISVSGKGNLYSPGFEKNQSYPDSVECQYMLHAPSGMHVRVTFNEMDIEATDFCAADIVSIHDLDSHGPLLGLHCGNHLPNDYVSNSSSLQVTLRTDSFGGGKGFNITYTAQSTTSVCPPGKQMCHNRNCIDPSQVCDGNDNCGDGTDEEKCTAVTLPTTECGKSEITPKPIMSLLDRIVGGQEVAEGSWPWMADFQHRIVEPNGHACGGALINAQWVLSAAHCFAQFPRPDEWRIRLGNHRKFHEDVGEQTRYAERIVIYDDIPPTTFERYGAYDLVHDIALVKLNAPVKFTKYVKPVCLPDLLTTLNDSSNCYAIGWGATRGSGNSDTLKQAYHPIKENVFCEQLVGNSFNPATMICAGSLDPLNGVCHGDSGGPLLCEEKGKWSVHGVASYVTAGTGTMGLCGLKGNPSVFNKVAVKRDYITRMINKYS